MTRVAWSPDIYLRFADDRARPTRDLLAALPPGPRAQVVDLGCGPGNSTALLAARYPEAQILGIDPDGAMLAAARAAVPQVRFQKGRAEDWLPATPPDMIFANASLQWAEDHDRLLPRLLGLLAPNGILAVQMPDNLDEPSHLAMREVAALPEWRDSLSGAARQRRALPDAKALHRLLRQGSSALQIWRTVYHVELPDVGAIIDWFSGSALRPYLSVLDKDAQARFLDRYRSALSERYPPLAMGQVLLGFPRLFFVAVRKG
ncbi:MAG: trans-aconitate 2-methyltransferase [Alphaproteobacteria bacterium]|nr:trans-aconitate 2-methyltransferase [Alphaproteobacteria bacterium]